jgi:hypothetical protein
MTLSEDDRQEDNRRLGGILYNSFNSVSGEVVDQNLADTWGYLLNAYQTFDLANGKDNYADEIQRSMQAAAGQHSIQWECRIIFDSPRHNQIWHLPSDYPRLNQLPEWYTVNTDSNYTAIVDGGSNTYNGQELSEGIHWQLPASGRQFIHLQEEK